MIREKINKHQSKIFLFVSLSFTIMAISDLLISSYLDFLNHSIGIIIFLAMYFKTKKRENYYLNLSIFGVFLFILYIACNIYLKFII